MIKKTIKKIVDTEFISAISHTSLTSGQVLRMLRELKGWTQEELAHQCGITATNLSLIENDRIDIGKKRAELLATAFSIHPAIIMFPEYESQEIARKVA